MDRQQLLPLERSEDFETVIRERITNETAVQFLMIMHRAANAAGPAGCAGREMNGRYLLDAPRRCWQSY